MANDPPALQARGVSAAFAVLILIASAAMAVVSSRSSLGAQFSSWGNLRLVSIAFALGGIAILTYAFWVKTAASINRNVTAADLLTLLLILHSSCVVILMWKYLSGGIPPTGSHAIIHLTATHHGSVTDLYRFGNLTEFPLVVTPYPPMYYLLLRGAHAVFGSTLSATYYVTGFSIAGILVGAACAVSRTVGSWHHRVATAGLFLVALTMITWSGAPTKPELPACALVAAGFAVYLRSGIEGERRWIVVAGALFGSALLIKYSLIGTLTGVALHLAWQRRVRNLLTLLLPAFGLPLIVYGWFAWKTSGGAVLFAVLGNGAQWTPFRSVQLGVFEFLPNPLVVIAIACVGGVMFIAEDNQRIRVKVVALLTSILLAVVSAGRPGASKNYFMEPALLSALLIGACLWSRLEVSRRLGLGLTAVVTAYLVTHLPQQVALLAQSYDVSTSTQVHMKLSQLPLKGTEFVLTDLEYTSAVVNAGLKPLLFDTVYYSFLADAGRIDVEPVLNMLRARRVPYVLLRGSIEWHEQIRGLTPLPRPVLTFIAQSYKCHNEMPGSPEGSQFVVCELIPAY